jgi:GDP-L-fucose synthase
MDKNARIYVAGHRGLVGSAILENLQSKGYTNFLLRTHAGLDLTDQSAVNSFFAAGQPEYVFLSAAYVGGIMANQTYRADFIYINSMIQSNVIHAAYTQGVKKLLFLGSTCIYPRETPQPMREDSLLASPLEYTNEPYAVAKIAGIKMCESYNLQYGTNFIAVMPANLYGPNDNFNLETSHVLPAMIRKIHLAHKLQQQDWEMLRKDLNARPVEGISGKASRQEISALLDARYGIRDNEVALWGTGKPMREFLWSEEMADATVYMMEHVDFSSLKPDGKEVRNTHVNIGTGLEISIREVAALVKETIGFQGKLTFDASKPDGAPRKLTDVSKLHALGWRHRIEINEGIPRLYNWYLNDLKNKQETE